MAAPLGSVAQVMIHWQSQEVMAQANRLLGLGIEAAAIFLAGRAQELLSVPAPRVRVLGKRGKVAGVYYYRATMPAVAGAPPRKLSGRLRGATTWEYDRGTLSARVGVDAGQVKYARRHEKGLHPFLLPTLQHWASSLPHLIGRVVAD